MAEFSKYRLYGYHYPNYDYFFLFFLYNHKNYLRYTHSYGCSRRWSKDINVYCYECNCFCVAPKTKELFCCIIASRLSLLGRIKGTKIVPFARRRFIKSNQYELYQPRHYKTFQTTRTQQQFVCKIVFGTRPQISRDKLVLRITILLSQENSI